MTDIILGWKDLTHPKVMWKEGEWYHFLGNKKKPRLPMKRNLSFSCGQSRA
jgi:hypothetical protein